MAATVDIQAVQSVDHPERGIARTVADLVRAIEERHAEAVTAYVYNDELPLPLALADLAAAGRLVAAPQLRRGQAAVHLVASPFEGCAFDHVVPPAVRLGGAALAVLVYDLIPLRFPEHYLSHPMARRRYSARLELIRSADLVLTISQQTARDATDLLGVAPRRVRVVGCAPSEAFGPAVDPAAAQAQRRLRFPSIGDRFVLCPGGADWRKNLGSLVDAWSELEEEGEDPVDLVITGNLRDQGELVRHRAQRAGLGSRIHLPGRVSDADLRLLYQTTDLVVFPSRFEGYGLPVMEARRSGAPVLAARTSSLTELLPDDALFDLEAVGELAERMAEALHDPARARALRDLPLPEGHTWPEVASRTVEALALVDGARAAPTRRRRRTQLAVVSPLPPTATGVADHTWRLLDALRRHVAVHAFTDQLSLVRPPEGVGLHRLRHLGRAGAGRGQFDAVIHCWGNSEPHASMLPAIRRWPGLVLAHDVAVAGLYDWCSRRAPDLVDHATFGQLLRRQYGDRLPAAVQAMAEPTYADADALGLTMAGEVVEASERYLVHSAAAARLAQADHPELAARVEVAPFAFPAVRPPRHPERVGAPPVVATFGIVSHTKQVDLVLSAFAALADRHPGIRLVYVGDVGFGLRRQLVEHADRLGVASQVLFTGRVPRETYEEWLAIADVAVQLRHSWGGEASAATADAMACGVPTVVSDIGWARELPDESVTRLAGDASTLEVAEAISELLTDGELRVVRSRAAVAHAEAHGFDRLAAELLRLVDHPPGRL